MLCGFGVFATGLWTAGSGLRALFGGVCRRGRANERGATGATRREEARASTPKMLRYGVPVCVWTVPEISPTSAE